MSAIKRLAMDLACRGCGRGNIMLLPEASCGNEFVWHARCSGCGEWRWFHSRQDAPFVRAVKDAALRRGEPGGLSPEGTREAHEAFASTVDACPCGGRFHVVREILDEPCLGCGRTLKDAALPKVRRREIDVPPLRSPTSSS
ncbi:MAG TPA: hypothetical protein VE981_00110 [Planctomycetota bacterium]|nr:hypothetical protein [Planctomycetota bacterium]